MKNFIYKIKNIISKYIPLVFILLLSANLSSTISKMKRAKGKIEEAEEELVELEEEKKKLEEQVEFVKSEEFVEKQVRDKLGLAKEGEIVVYLPDEEVVRKLALVYEDEADILPDPNWKKWLHLFFY